MGNTLSRLSTPLKLSRDDNGEPFRRDYHRNTLETSHHHSLPIQVCFETMFSLISNPHFIKTHLNRNTSEHDRLILLFNSVDFYSVLLKSSQFSHDSLAALHLKFPPNQYPNHGLWSLRDENFQIMPFPTLQYAHRLKLWLGALDGCLRVLVPLCNGCQDVWVMKEYGVRDSWTKITIGSKILCLPRTGQVLFDTRRNKLMLFDPQEEKCRELVVRSGSSQFEAGTYVESLVSPNWSNMIKSGWDALKALENNDDVTKTLHQYFQGKFPEGSLQAQMEACEAKNKADLSKAKRYRLDE
ncbi:unnamed protein product [Camellia sinensis]